MTKRREILKGLTVAGATGVVWRKPIVNAVNLPAHAQTSCIGTVCFTIDVAMTGNYDGGYSYDLYSITDQCLFIERDENRRTESFVKTVCFVLELGQYSFFAGGGAGGSDGSVTARATLNCCGSESGIVSEESVLGDDVGGAEFGAIISIRSDGFCLIEETDGLPTCFSPLLNPASNPAGNLWSSVATIS